MKKIKKNLNVNWNEITNQWNNDLLLPRLTLVQLQSKWGRLKHKSYNLRGEDLSPSNVNNNTLSDPPDLRESEMYKLFKTKIISLVEYYSNTENKRSSTKLNRRPNKEHINILSTLVEDTLAQLSPSNDNLLKTLSALVYSIAIMYKHKYDFKIVPHVDKTQAIISKIATLQREIRKLQSALSRIKLHKKLPPSVVRATCSQMGACNIHTIKSRIRIFMDRKICLKKKIAKQKKESHAIWLNKLFLRSEIKVYNIFEKNQLN